MWLQCYAWCTVFYYIRNDALHDTCLPSFRFYCSALTLKIVTCCFAPTVCASDKRIACDEEFSDSEDEGDGRRNRDSFKHKRPRIEEKSDSKSAPSGK
jgi:hypothetical protein